MLAKFVAADQLSGKIEGVLVHLVVDHHIGNSGEIELPDNSGQYLSTKKLTIANLDSHVAMKDLPRSAQRPDSVFSRALLNAKGENAAMQFANATDDLMADVAKVDYCIAGTSLLTTELGKAIVTEMRKNPTACIAAYNSAVDQFPERGVPMLGANELPLWHGKTNEKVTINFDDLRPRALLLTLLARTIVGDLFVHGTGGFAYDDIMERWLLDWLHVTPCAKVMATTTVTLPLDAQTIEQARREYYSSPKHFLDAIERAPHHSTLRQQQFYAMHSCLEKLGTKPDIQALKKAQQIANRSDWAFPLYGKELTKDFEVAKSAEASLSCSPK